VVKVGDSCARFSASIAWDSIRYRGMEVSWGNNVWFSQCVLVMPLCYGLSCVVSF